MFNHNTDYPTAVASYDEEGVAAAIAWCVERTKPGDTISVWTSLKSNLRNCRELESFVRKYRNVEHITGRGGGTPSGSGPVLMAWADMRDIGELVRFSSGISGLCVISWNKEKLRPWVQATKPDILGDGGPWCEETPELHPVLLEALESLTKTVNHNNTISAGFEKDQVVSVLLALHKASIPMDADAVQGWALANGWSGKNPERLAQYIRDITSGKRPQSRSVVREDYVDMLRQRVAAAAEEDQ
jgi:hypothetical protein